MLIVSVHDVAPSTESDVRWLLARLDEAGIGRRVLKVIPHEDGRSDLRHHPDLVALLRDEVARGSEVVVHGWTHREVGPLWGAPPDIARGRLFGGGRAELLSVGQSEVATRVRAGVEMLIGLGLAPIGYCPPAWLARSDLVDAARAARLAYVVWLTSVEDLRTGRKRVVPQTGYLGVGGAHEAMAQVGGLISATVARQFDVPLRIGLHPQGSRTSPHVRRAVELARRLGQVRQPSTYRDLLDAPTDAVADA